jgi:hypothetical protein
MVRKKEIYRHDRKTERNIPVRKKERNTGRKERNTGQKERKK